MSDGIKRHWQSRKGAIQAALLGLEYVWHSLVRTGGEEHRVGVRHL